MHVWNMLHAAHWKYRMQKNRHFGTITQLCRAISSKLRHISTIGKKNLLNSNTSSTCPDNIVNLRPTNSWDLLASSGHPCKFQRVSHLGSVTARHSSSGRQPNFAALDRGRHLFSAGRPSRWALAYILVDVVLVLYSQCCSWWSWRRACWSWSHCVWWRYTAAFWSRSFL